MGRVFWERCVTTGGRREAHNFRVCQVIHLGAVSCFVSAGCGGGLKSGGASGRVFSQDAPPGTSRSSGGRRRWVEWSDHALVPPSTHIPDENQVHGSRNPELIEIIQKILRKNLLTGFWRGADSGDLCLLWLEWSGRAGSWRLGGRVSATLLEEHCRGSPPVRGGCLGRVECHKAKIAFNRSQSGYGPATEGFAGPNHRMLSEPSRADTSINAARLLVRNPPGLRVSRLYFIEIAAETIATKSGTVALRISRSCRKLRPRSTACCSSFVITAGCSWRKISIRKTAGATRGCPTAPNVRV